MTREAAEKVLRPDHQARIAIVAAQARWRLATEKMADLFTRYGRATTTNRSASDLWVDLSFRAAWDETQRHLDVALRTLGQTRTRFPGYVGVWALEADVCQASARLARLRAKIVGRESGTAVQDALNEAERYDRRHVIALTNELRCQPFSDALTVGLLRANAELPMEEMIDWVRRPLRGPYLPEAYQAVILQVSTDKAFRPTLVSFLDRAERIVKTPGSRRSEDRFAPETLRMAAMIAAAERKMDQAVLRLEQCLLLYSADHPRFCLQHALVTADLAWYGLIRRPDRPQEALASLQRAVEISGRPPWHPTLHPIYRKMVHVLLAAGEESAARDVVSSLPWLGQEPDPNAHLAWSYEVLGKTFHRLAPQDRPLGWRQWVERAAQLDPHSPGIQLLVAAMSCERGDDVRAAGSLEQAWRRSKSRREFQECVRTLRYALSRNPGSKALQSVYEQIGRAIQAATQPTSTQVVPDEENLTDFEPDPDGAGNAPGMIVPVP